MKTALLTLFFSLSLFAQDISGVYQGTLKVEPSGQSDGTGYIVIKKAGEALTITAGPSPEEQHNTIHVERKGEQLKFEVDDTGDGARVMKFDLLAKDGKLTGTITMASGSGTKLARLDLVKK